MKRVLVLGSPGSGKSTFSRKLSKKTGLPNCYLDQLFWNADKTTVSRETFEKRLAKELIKESWIMDGNYNFTLRKRLEYCDTIFLLDYPTKVCLDGVRNRIGKIRPDMPWIEEEIDPEFMDYIKKFRNEQLPEEKALLNEYSDRKIIVFKSRNEANRYLSEL